MTDMARETKAEKLARAEKTAARIASVVAVVKANKCPLCGAGIRHNLALTGWVQCEQLGDGHFRKDQNKPSCSWQGFTV